MSKDKVKKCEYCGKELGENGVCTSAGRHIELRSDQFMAESVVDPDR